MRGDLTDIRIEKTSFATDDKVQLSGTWYLPETPRAVMVISGATGVPERYYRHFARWLAEEEKVAALTYTYRDTEDGSPSALRASRATLADWGITDGQAARDAAKAAFPDVPLWVIGHSIGGMFLSKQPRLAGINRAFTVASGLVSISDHPLRYRIGVWFFWYVFGPLSILLTGYLHGKLSGLGNSLPASAFASWRRWCTSGERAFLVDDSLPRSDWSGSGGAPVRIVGLSDDAVCPPQNAFRLKQTFDGADVETVTMDPATHGVKSLGHLGLLSKAGRPYWPELIA